MTNDHNAYAYRRSVLASKARVAFDGSIDLARLTGSPLLVYGRSSNISSGGFRPFTTAGDTYRYYPTWFSNITKTIPACGPAPTYTPATGSSGSKIFAVLHPTVSGSTITSATATGGATSFNLLVSSSGNKNVSASALSSTETSTSFISSYFGTNPQNGDSTLPGYVYAVFPDAIAQAGANVTMTATTSTLSLLTQYNNATTPWIRSQTIGGSKYNLFKVHTLSDGTGANKEVKISITGISPSIDPDSDFGSFSLLVRDFNDTDKSPNVLESFNNLNLDPTSPNYIARVIGNAVPTYNSSTGLTTYEGDYPNVSKYIRVEMSQDVIPETAVPYGFTALNSVMSSSAGEVPLTAYVNSRWVSASVAGWNSDATGPNTNYYGFNFDGVYVSGSVLTAESYLGPIVGSNTVGGEFSIENLPATEVNGSAISLTNRDHATYRRFSVPFQGGFDGFNQVEVSCTQCNAW